MNPTERIPIILVERDPGNRRAFRACLEGSRFKVWTDTAYSDHLLPLYRTLSPRLAVVDITATPQTESGPTPMAAIKELHAEFPKACVVVSYNADTKYLVSGMLDAGARGIIARPYTAERVLQGIGMAITNREQKTAKLRHMVRVPARLALYYKDPPARLWSQTRVSQTEDVCETGARFRVDHAFRPGETLKVELSLASTQPPMRFRARVARCEQVKGFPLYDVGLNFMEMQDRDRASLRGFVHLAIADGRIL